MIETKFLNEQLFTWKNFKDINALSCRFDDVETLCKIGDFPPKTKFPTAMILGGCLLVLYDDNFTPHGFQLDIAPTNPIKIEDVCCDTKKG